MGQQTQPLAIDTATSVAVDELVNDSMAWCAQHGLVYGASREDNQALLVHAPFALTPVPFPEASFMEAKQLATAFNAMIDRVSRDGEYLVTVLEEACKYDEFTRRLVEIYQEVSQKNTTSAHQDNGISLAITRSDYMLHEPTGIMLQVELNTIASSFGCLSSLVSKLHRYILDRCGVSGDELDARLPENVSMDRIVEGLAAAVDEHGHSDKVMMMVVQPGEQNSFDQQWLQFHLWSRFRIKTMRRTLADVAERATVTSDGELMIDGKTVSLVYFRAGYTPNDYPSEKEWEARRLIEQSHAAKCPTVALQLAGSKKVQQDLARPGVIEKYSENSTEARKMRKSFAGLWGLEQLTSDPEASSAVQDAIEHPENYVLKPQREGGGNNIYGEELARKLQSGDPLGALILMQRILPPEHTALMVRNGQVQQVQSLSEVGVYGTFLRRGDTILLNEEAGHLVRTKAATSSEGGVAAGFAVLDSPQLI